MNRDEFREQMTRCSTCGALMDGGCCPPAPIAVYITKEHDTWVGPMEYHVEAVQTMDCLCLECASVDDIQNGGGEIEEVFDRRTLHAHGFTHCQDCGVLL